VDLSRLLRPRSIAVVGASERPGSYGGETLLNLRRLGFDGDVWGVHPTRESAHGVACVPALADLPAVPDAVVIAIPAGAVPGAVDEAGALGCGGAVVFGAGFAEAGEQDLQAELAAAAARHGLPVCGPNGNGIVALHSRAALWGDALAPGLQAGEVALVSQSGNVAVNALATRRGLRFHTVVSCGNQAVLDAAGFVDELAAEEGVRSIALYLEDDGDGERLCEALARCAERGVGVAVLKVASSKAGMAAAAAHTGAVAGDQRVFRALVEEAGAAWAADVHELLELAKALAVQARTAASGLGILTCSGGDSALAADYCARLGVALPPLAEPTMERLGSLLPTAATAGNPLDYTAMIWGDAAALGEIVTTAGSDPGIDRLLVLYDQPVGIEGTAADDSWAAVREGIRRGAATSPAPVIVASTLPELLDDESAHRFAEAGVPAIAGLHTGLRCAAELMRAPADPGRLREIAAATATARAAEGAGGDLAEHEAKALLAEAGVAVPLGRVVGSEDEAAAALADLGGPVAIKLSIPELRHKSENGVLALGLEDEDSLRAAFRRLAAWLDGAGALLVERMERPGAELIVAARADGVVPALVVGLGGIWAEIHDDVAIVPLPATPERVERALRSLRGAPLLTGGRGRPALDVAAAAALGARVGELLLERGLSLIELNPVIVHDRGAVAVDAVAAR
jgi:acyl-CoA synthetase (NDP forming)